MRLGQPPKGLKISGVIVSGAHVDRHWEKKRAANGEISSFVDVILDISERLEALWADHTASEFTPLNKADIDVLLTEGTP